MVKINKIVQFGLENEVKEMSNSGMTQLEIAKQVSAKHPNIILSAMSVNRYLKDARIAGLQEELNIGSDPNARLRQEFREKMGTLDDETHQIYSIMKKTLKKITESGTDLDVIKAAKDTLNAIEQSRKNWNTLLEHSYSRFLDIQEAKQTNFIQINNDILEFSDDLCPECSKKVAEKISKKLISIKEKQ